jgi:hypothetical protein
LQADLKLLALISGSARLGRLCGNETIVDSDAPNPERLLSTTPVFINPASRRVIFSLFHLYRKRAQYTKAHGRLTGGHERS